MPAARAKTESSSPPGAGAGSATGTPAGLAGSEPDRRRRTASRFTEAAGYLLILVIAGIATAIPIWLVQDATRAYEGNQVLGVVAQGQAPADGAMSATKQWVAVGSSAPFADAVAGRTGQEVQEVRAGLTVRGGDNAPVLTVTYRGDDQARISRTVTDVTRAMQAGSTRIDPRYPLRPLTEVGISQVRGLGAVGLPVILLSLALGALVFAAGISLFRRIAGLTAGSRAG